MQKAINLQGFETRLYKNSSIYNDVKPWHAKSTACMMFLKPWYVKTIVCIVIWGPGMQNQWHAQCEALVSRKTHIYNDVEFWCTKTIVFTMIWSLGMQKRRYLQRVGALACKNRDVLTMIWSPELQKQLCSL